MFLKRLLSTKLTLSSPHANIIQYLKNMTIILFHFSALENSTSISLMAPTVLRSGLQGGQAQTR